MDTKASDIIMMIPGGVAALAMTPFLILTMTPIIIVTWLVGMTFKALRKF